MDSYEAAIRAQERAAIIRMLQQLEGGRFREDVKLGIEIAWLTIDQVDSIYRDAIG